MIPKIIHYCWFGRSPLPKKAKKCIESWRQYLPDYEIRGKCVFGRECRYGIPFFIRNDVFLYNPKIRNYHPIHD